MCAAETSPLARLVASCGIARTVRARRAVCDASRCEVRPRSLIVVSGSGVVPCSARSWRRDVDASRTDSARPCARATSARSCSTWRRSRWKMSAVIDALTTRENAGTRMLRSTVIWFNLPRLWCAPAQPNRSSGGPLPHRCAAPTLLWAGANLRDVEGKFDTRTLVRVVGLRNQFSEVSKIRWGQPRPSRRPAERLQPLSGLRPPTTATQHDPLEGGSALVPSRTC